LAFWEFALPRVAIGADFWVCTNDYFINFGRFPVDAD
jgi:hypothetical protein